MKRENLKIAEPCTENFDAMHPSEGSARFCDKCTKNVHNLSEMTREEAAEFLAENGDSNLCVVYKFDAKSKNVLFKESRSSFGQLAGLKRLVAAAAMVPLLAACDTAPEYPPESDEVRPIDLIREQEDHFMDFFSDLFGTDEPEVMCAFAFDPQVLGELEAPPEYPTYEEVLEPTVDEIPEDHEIREELDNETKPPIRRLMGKVAPTRIPTPEPEEVDEQRVQRVMGDVAVEF